MARDTQENAQLVTLSRPDSHLVPLKANGDGQFVTMKSGKFIVSLNAVFRFRSGSNIFKGKLKESEVIFSRFVYIGTVYPDGSSLPFIPVADAEISGVDRRYHCVRRRSHYSDESDTQKDAESLFAAEVKFAQSIWKDVLRKLSCLASFSYFRIENRVNERTDNTDASEKIAIPCHVAVDREAAVCLNNIWFTKRMKEALEGNKTMRGNVFLMPKCTRAPGSETGKLSFEIYGMWVTEDLEELFGPFHWQKVIY